VSGLEVTLPLCHEEAKVLFLPLLEEQQQKEEEEICVRTAESPISGCLARGCGCSKVRPRPRTI
jgi:hypothetical protein